MTDTDATGLPDEKGIRHTLKRYLGPDGVTMILLGLLAIVGIGITDFSPQAQSLVLARDGTCYRDCLHRHGMVTNPQKGSQRHGHHQE